MIIIYKNLVIYYNNSCFISIAITLLNYKIIIIKNFIKRDLVNSINKGEKKQIIKIIILFYFLLYLLFFE